MKQYQEDNKEKISEQQKQYREENKKKISEKKEAYSEVKISCKCGSQICQGTTNRHKLTTNHINFINSQMTNSM